MKVNYNVDDYSVLRIYKDNYLLVEIPECENMSEEQVKNLIHDYLEEIEIKVYDRIEEVLK